MTPSTVDEAIGRARSAGLDRLDAQLLVAHALERPRSWVVAHGDEALRGEEASKLEAWITRRAGGEPLAYLTGEKEFHGLRLQVDARVLVPRPDTETLADWALELLRDPSPGWPDRPAVVDLGTGSGALAAAIARSHANSSMLALDRSQDALSVARDNFRRLGLDVECRAGDWWSAVGDRRFDLAVSNPPYVAEADPHLAALAYEPITALAAGPDGLGDIRRIVAGAPRHLQPGGWLLLEHGHDQAGAVRSLLSASGFLCTQSRRDLAGIERCSGGQRPPAA